MWPAQGTVTSPFGHDGGRWHPGIDIGILRSTVVRAAEPGRVAAVGTPRGFEGYGNVVKVSLGGGWFALYAHLAGWRVRVGERVSAGQRLGPAGRTRPWPGAPPPLPAPPPRGGGGPPRLPPKRGGGRPGSAFLPGGGGPPP